MVELDRKVEENQLSELVAMTMMLYSMPRLKDDIDALCVFPGMAESWRVVEAIGFWNKGVGKYLWIAHGSNPKEKEIDLSVDVLAKPPFNLKFTGGVTVSNIYQNNTALQAEWVLTKIKDHNISSLALFVSPYHLLRAYLTLLKALLKARIPWITLIPVPVHISPSVIIPESGIDAWESVPGELARLKMYQEKGYVATYQELQAYLLWFWNHSPYLAS